ncbi:Myc-type basic helix-loop-helix (bHLH) domain, partial [Trinorchestia longiramus]
MSGNMINSSNAVTVRSTNDEVSSNEIVKQETKPSHSSANELEVNENCVPKAEDEVNEERRGIKRPIEADDFVDDDDQSSFDSEPFKEELDDDSSGDKVWDNFQGIRKQRGGRLSRTYGLRPRTGIRRAWVEGEVPPTRGASRRGRGRASALKSKYRRNTANARERDRMKEINVAFANLRGALPSFTCRRITSMTKIKTLKLAASYIRALSDLLSDSPSEESKTLALQLFQDIPEQNSFVNSMRHTLDTNVNTFEVACGSQISNTSHKNVSMVSTPTMNIVTSRTSSALEAALTNTCKRPTYNIDQGQRFFSQGHHLASRPNFVPPPPLQLPNMNSISNLHGSPTQHSPLLSTYPASPVVPPNSDSSHFMSFPNPSSTIITANVNVIPLHSECSSDQMNMVTPCNSPLSNKTYAPQTSFSSSSSHLSMTYMQSNANEFASNSTASLPDSSTSRIFYQTKTSMGSISPDVCIHNQSLSPSYSVNEQI